MRLIAIGSKAAETLNKDDHAIRHPSMGGATAFRDGMATLFGTSVEKSNRSIPKGLGEPWLR